MAELWDILDEKGNKTGRFHERGKPMYKGEYHLIVQVWIMNRNGDFLISRRKLGTGRWDGLWQTTGGCAVAGDDSLKTALKETGEEIGIALDPKNGVMYKQYNELHLKDEGSSLFDIWLFRQEVDIATIVFQPEETCDAKWASKKQIYKMIDDGIFIHPKEAYPYIDELFIYVEGSK